jgi:hypothetical protein
MKIRSTFALICFIIALLATSCTNKAIDEQLSLAESLMTERPDSALSIMNGIESDELTGDRQKALYALLMTQARYKNYIDETNDSLINIAVEYFESHDDTRYKMLANYYCSRISQKNDNYTMSLYLLLKAFDYAKELNDDFWIGMIAQGISDDYTDTFNFPSAIRYAEIEYEYFKKFGKESYIRDGLLDLARSYHNNNEYDVSNRYAKMLINAIDTTKHNYLYREVMYILGVSYYSQRKLDSAFACLKPLCELPQATAKDTAFLGTVYVLNNNVGEAKKLLTRENEIIDVPYERFKQDYYLKTGQLEKALSAYHNADSLSDDMLRKRIDANMNGILAKYYEQSQDLANAKLESERQSKRLFIAVSVLSIVIIIAVSHNRWKRQQYRIEKNILLANNLRESLMAKENETSELQKAVHDLFVSRYSDVNELCRRFSEVATFATQKQISAEVTNMIEQMSSDKDKLAELEECANKYLSNIMSDFRRDLPNLKDDDYKLYLYSILGFSASTIELFLKESKVENVYNRKARLKSKINQLEQSQRERYLSCLK